MFGCFLTRIFNHDNIKTYCQRPDDFTQRLDKNVHATVKPGDTLIHLGDVGVGKPEGFMAMVAKWPGYKMLVRGNHDSHSCQWYVDHGFHAAVDAMMYRSCWLTHHPWTDPLPAGTNLNLHGHLHNCWDGFGANDPAQKEEFLQAFKLGKLPREYNRLFAVEYTDYRPVDFNKFIQKPDKYQARGPNQATKKRVFDRVVDEVVEKAAQELGYAAASSVYFQNQRSHRPMVIALHRRPYLLIRMDIHDRFEEMYGKI